MTCNMFQLHSLNQAYGFGCGMQFCLKKAKGGSEYGIGKISFIDLAGMRISASYIVNFVKDLIDK